MAKFEIKKSSNGSYFFNLKASGNHEIILNSEMYQSKSGCEKGIVSVKENAPYDLRYERLYSANGQYYFNLKGENGKVIGTSEMYKSSLNRDLGIELIKSQAPFAAIEDLS